MTAAWHRCVIAASQSALTSRHASALSGDFARQYRLLPRNLLGMPWAEFILLVEGLGPDALFVSSYQHELTEVSARAATVGVGKRTRDQFIAQLRRHSRGKVVES